MRLRNIDVSKARGSIPIMILLAAIWGTPAAVAQEGRLGDLMMELHKVKKVPRLDEGCEDIWMVYWLADEHWALSLEAAGAPAAVSREFRTMFKDKVVMMVAVNTIPALGSPGLEMPPQRSALWVRNNTRLIGADGKPIKPIAPEQLHDGLRTSIRDAQQGLAESMGIFANNLQVLVFPYSDQQGASRPATAKPRKLELMVAGSRFRWDLPLDASLPPQVCKTCDRDCKGSWKFCPWCGGAPKIKSR